MDKVLALGVLILIFVLFLLIIVWAIKATMGLLKTPNDKKGPKYKYYDKDTNIFCKIILHILIIGGFVFLLKYPPTNFFEEFLYVGISLALIRICFSISILDTFLDLFLFCGGAFTLLLPMKIICFLFSIDYAGIISSISFLGLIIAFICSFISEGHYLSLYFGSDRMYSFDGVDSSPEPEKKKKGPSWDVTTIHNSDGSTSLASTYSDNGYSMTTIHHDNGKTTKIDESTIGGVRSIRVDKD